MFDPVNQYIDEYQKQALEDQAFADRLWDEIQEQISSIHGDDEAIRDCMVNMVIEEEVTTLLYDALKQGPSRFYLEFVKHLNAKVKADAEWYAERRCS